MVKSEDISTFLIGIRTTVCFSTCAMAKVAVLLGVLRFNLIIGLSPEPIQDTLQSTMVGPINKIYRQSMAFQ